MLGKIIKFGKTNISLISVILISTSINLFTTIFTTKDDLRLSFLSILLSSLFFLIGGVFAFSLLSEIEKIYEVANKNYFHPETNKSENTIESLAVAEGSKQIHKVKLKRYLIAILVLSILAVLVLIVDVSGIPQLLN